MLAHERAQVISEAWVQLMGIKNNHKLWYTVSAILCHWAA